jgi:methionine sulfoxide reductase catalytic subunit
MMGHKINSSEITPERLYFNRRNFIRAGVFAGTAVATGTIYRSFNPLPQPEVTTAAIEKVTANQEFSAAETPDSLETITTYNNYYEFSTSKSGPANKAKGFVTSPWTIAVGGLVQKPRVFDIEELLRLEQEERIYRFRCVEAWSMVVPWTGFPLRKILDLVEPMGSARYVAFETYYNGQSEVPNAKLPPGPNGMQSSFSAGIDFPYVEGLRLDEALHPLTLLATGIYGKQMPNQNGAPIRLVVPWKYGFKSIKSIVKITLTEIEPPTTWNLANSDEYGFYSNVNPSVPHPRWSQRQERRLRDSKMQETQLFNGYGEEVAGLYAGMDLKKYF